MKGADCMNKGILTPLGEIQIYIDNIRSDYEYKQHYKNIKFLLERLLQHCYVSSFCQEWFYES